MSWLRGPSLQSRHTSSDRVAINRMPEEVPTKSRYVLRIPFKFSVHSSGMGTSSPSRSARSLTPCQSSLLQSPGTALPPALSHSLLTRVRNGIIVPFTKRQAVNTMPEQRPSKSQCVSFRTISFRLANTCIFFDLPDGGRIVPYTKRQAINTMPEQIPTKSEYVATCSIKFRLLKLHSGMGESLR